MHYVPQWVFSIIGEVTVAIIAGLIIMIWGWWEGTGRWSAVVGGIVVLAAVFVVLNQSGLLGPTVKEKIRTWFNEVSFSIRELPQNASSNDEFVFEVTVPTKTTPTPEIKFYVYRPKYALNGFVIMKAGYNPAASFPKLKDLDKKRFQLLLRTLQKDLAIKGVTFDFEKANSITIIYSIPVPSVTQTSLMQGYDALINGLIIVTHNIGIAVEDY